MRTDDIFEAMTDIDDKFIEAARPIEHDSILIAVPAPISRSKRAVWKTLVPAAAFVAVVAAAGVFGVKYLHGIESANPAASITSESIATEYPACAQYIVDDDIMPLYWVFPDGSPSWFDDRADYANSYKELAKRSDIIVSGTFIDDIHQLQDSNKIVVADDECAMYNKLEIDSVIKGDLSRGEVIIIHQDSSINASNGEGKLIFVLDQLSPMLKGDKWVYFLKLEDDGTFSPVNGPQGRYPLPNSTNRLISSDGETPNVDEYFTYENAAPAREEIYEELLKKLAEIKAPELEGIFIPEESFTPFTMPEFPDVEFNASRLGVTANDADIFNVKENETLANLYLADLNGDGRRELCATISKNDRRRALVRDFENGVSYTLPDSESEEYILDVKDNALNVVVITHESIDCVSSTSKPLTFDMLVKEITYDPNEQLTEVALDTNHTFTLPDFEGFEFNVDTSYDHPQFSYWYENRSRGSANHVNNVYFSDLDGDGQREIILNCPFGDLGWIRIYGFMDNGEIGEALYFENSGCRLVKADGKLNIKNESGEIPFEFSRSHLKPMYEYKYSYVPLGWNHSLDYKEIVPASAIYNIRIEDRTLKITCGGETAFSHDNLGELNIIPDAENNRLIFVFSNENNNCIDAFMLSEQSKTFVCLNDANVIETAHTEYSDDVIYFKDGRSVSINNILSCFETTDNS